MLTVALLLVALVVVGTVAAAAVWLSRTLRAGLVSLRAEADAQLADRNADVDRRLEAMTATMDRRLESTSQTASAIHKQLGELGRANAEILARAGELQKLETLLRPPKARGGFGELLLENLLRDRLPPQAYELQYAFRSGERVDAVVRVDRLVPIDAKFPLDNYERAAAAASDDERALHERAFARDIKGHIDTIRTKYVRPDEGTYDFALMYLPAEAVYYELVCGKTGALLQYAHERRVFPVSPTTLYAQLQVVALGLKGLQIEQHAQEVMAYVADLQRDFERFRDDFDVVGKHIGNAQSKYAEAEKRLDRFETKLERASEHEAVEDAPEVRALDAA